MDGVEGWLGDGGDDGVQGIPEMCSVVVVLWFLWWAVNSQHDDGSEVTLYVDLNDAVGVHCDGSDKRQDGG